MLPFSRLFKILRVVKKYRLDEFIEKNQGTLSIHLLLRSLWFIKRADEGKSQGTRLRTALEELGPIYIKFGQLLSTRKDFIPVDISKDLEKLQDSVPPFEEPEIGVAIEIALGKKPEEIFRSLDSKPFASASVAQVHKAILKNGDKVVVKVVRPGIEKIILQDIQLLKWLARLLQSRTSIGKRLRPVEIVNDYKSIILNELNLKSEAANTVQLGRNFSSSPQLYVPKVYWDFTSENVMTMEQIDGIPVNDIRQLKQNGIDLKKLAETGVDIFFTQVFEHNFFHADMHPGNIFVSKTTEFSPQFIAIDCAIVGTLTKDDQEYLARNLLAIFNRDYKKVADLHVECGWVPKQTNKQAFESTIRTVCEPIFEKPLGDISFGKLLVQLFQTAGRFNMEVQPSLVLLQKTLLNIEGLGRQLYPDLNLWKTALPYLENWNAKRLNPLKILEKFQENIPIWIEKLPEYPELFAESLNQNSLLKEQNALLLQSLASRDRDRKTKQTRRKIVGLISIFISVILILEPSLYQITNLSAGPLLFGSLGVYLLYFKR
ncbi:MAG: ubiquinone biosynthesis regulatory protein kinase UbiB [Gammaproteobacteria bacterium]|nr:ubiquinone biosynthesis regulatory protein kinase UbiB [Gammaproteobacteria bacterium]